MKVIRASYFKPNGKFEREDTLYIKEGLPVQEAIQAAIPGQLAGDRHLFVYTEDAGDQKEPFLMPHLYLPQKE